MMTKKLSLKGLLKRSFVLYLVVAIILYIGVDGLLWQAYYTRYLGVRFVNEQLQNYRDGVIYFSRMARLDPTNASIYRDLGACFFQLKEYDKAIAAYAMAMNRGLDEAKFQEAITTILQEGIQHDMQETAWQKVGNFLFR